MKSPFRHEDVKHYPGGKGLSFRHLINLMPPHSRYIETHLGGGAVMRNKRPAQVNVGIDIDERVAKLWERRQAYTVITGCVLDALPALEPDADTLIYADPPYLADTRRTERYYRHDYSERDHERLLELLIGVSSMVIVSGYPSPMYDRFLSGWHRISYQATTHNGPAEEIAWTNFTPGALLHDYRYVGSNFRERESFKRRAGRLASTLQTAGDLELNSALAILGERRPDALIAAARRVS